MVSTLNIVFIFSPSATEGHSPWDDGVSGTNQSPVLGLNRPMRGEHRPPLTGVSVTNVTWRLVSDWGRVNPGAGSGRGADTDTGHNMSRVIHIVCWPGLVTSGPRVLHLSDVITSVKAEAAPDPPGPGRHICIVCSGPRQQNPAKNNRKVAVKNQSNSRQSNLGHQPEILSRDQLPNVKILKEKSIKQTRIGHFLSWLAH